MNENVRELASVGVVAVIPALNAAHSLSHVIDEARQHIEPVVVVDDGSTDATQQVAQNAGAVVLRHSRKRGKGAALRSAFDWAIENGFDAVLTLDADGQHLPREIPRFLREWQSSAADLIIGGRSHLFPKMLARRRNANRFSAWCIAKASGARITDSQSGFRLYSTRLIRRISLRADGFDMESEVLIRAGRAGMKIVTIPIDLGFADGVATSHYRTLTDTLRIAWTVVRVFASTIRSRK